MQNGTCTIRNVCVVLSQVSKKEAVAELTRPVAGVLLTLMSNLSQTFRVADMAEATVQPSDTEQLSQYIALLDDSRALPSSKSVSSCGGSRSSYAALFQVVLRGLLQHVIGCSAYGFFDSASLSFVAAAAESLQLQL